MQSALPQVPTLCSGKQEVPGYYEISVFSPKDVLEGDMRRAWSSALFQTMEALVSEKSLKGACSSKEPICFVNVTDALMVRTGIRYELLLNQRTVSGVRSVVEAFHGTEFSDSWYFAWWDALMTSKESDRPESTEYAAVLGKTACEGYLQATAAAFRTRDKQPPSCSVLLATDKALYLEMSFSDLVGALVSNNLADLPMTIGRALDGTAYDGQVIVKSPWMNMTDGTEGRVYDTVPLHALEFLFEELHSGTRSETDSLSILVSRYRGEGQTTKSDLLRSDQKGSLIIRNAAVVTVKFGQDMTASLQTTDGAEWQVSNENLTRCGVSSGSEISILVIPEKSPSMSVQKHGETCHLDAAFESGW
jgi:hypothetical protein